MARIKFHLTGSNRKFSTAKSIVPGCYYTSAYLGSKTKAFSGTIPEGANVEDLKVRLKAIGATKIEAE